MSPFDAVPCGYDLAMRPVEAVSLRRLRARTFGRLQGRILELGVGTGANLGAYPPSAWVVGIDESPSMLEVAQRKPSARLARMDAGGLGFADGTFDAVAASLVLCSVPNPAAVLAEVTRVLRPGGRLVLLEHVRGAHPLMARLTDLLDRPWYALNGSCHLNRETAEIVQEAGFRLLHEKRRLLGLLQTIEAVRP